MRLVESCDRRYESEPGVALELPLNQIVPDLWNRAFLDESRQMRIVQHRVALLIQKFLHRSC